MNKTRLVHIDCPYCANEKTLGACQRQRGDKTRQALRELVEAAKKVHYFVAPDKDNDSFLPEYPEAIMVLESAIKAAERVLGEGE